MRVFTKLPYPLFSTAWCFLPISIFLPLTLLNDDDRMHVVGALFRAHFILHQN